MEGERERAELETDFPGWRIGYREELWNAWRTGTKPPLVIRDATVAGLRGQLEEMRALGEEFPLWHVWEHVGTPGLFYARRPRSSPALVAGPVRLAGLRAAIRKLET